MIRPTKNTIYGSLLVALLSSACGNRDAILDGTEGTSIDQDDTDPDAREDSKTDAAGNTLSDNVDTSDKTALGSGAGQQGSSPALDSNGDSTSSSSNAGLIAESAPGGSDDDSDDDSDGDDFADDDSADDGAFASAGAAATDLNAGAPQTEDAASDVVSAEPIANTNVSLGGSQDFGFFRNQLENGVVPAMDSFDAAGFFAEHHTQLPSPDCGNRVCLQAMLGVMSNLMNGNNCTMLQLGLNSPIAADADSRPPLSLAVVVDTSGSMLDDNKMEFVRDGLGLLIDGLKDGDTFSLITYDSDADVVFPYGEVEGNRVELRNAVAELAASGSTNLYEGLEAGYREIFSNYDSGRQNRVILLSDGNPTAGITDSESIIERSKSYNSEGVGLTTIGLGSDFNIELMRDLALQADGNFYFLENAGAVSEVFDEELSFFTVPIAFDLKLEVQAGTDYEFGRAVGSPLWEGSANGGILEVPSVFVAHRDSAADITEDGGRRGGGSALLLELMPRLLESDGSDQTDAQVARIDVEFREPGSDMIVNDTIFVNYPLAPWEMKTKGYFDNVNNESDDVTVVQKSFIMLNIFVGIENAVASFYENGRDPSGSIGELEALLAAVRDYNEEIADTDLEFDIALIQELIDVMVANDIQPPDVLNIPEDPWPAD